MHQRFFLKPVYEQKTLAKCSSGFIAAKTSRIMTKEFI